MHMRVAERRELLQVERWAALTQAVERASAEAELVAEAFDCASARALVGALQAVLRHLRGSSYSHEGLSAAVSMVAGIAGILPQFAADAGLVPALETMAGPEAVVPPGTEPEPEAAPPAAPT
jgi:hypothetical protein